MGERINYLHYITITEAEKWTNTTKICLRCFQQQEMEQNRFKYLYGQQLC